MRIVRLADGLSIEDRTFPAGHTDALALETAIISIVLNLTVTLVARMLVMHVPAHGLHTGLDQPPDPLLFGIVVAVARVMAESLSVFIALAGAGEGR